MRSTVCHKERPEPSTLPGRRWATAARRRASRCWPKASRRGGGRRGGRGGGGGGGGGGVAAADGGLRQVLAFGGGQHRAVGPVVEPLQQAVAAAREEAARGR